MLARKDDRGVYFFCKDCRQEEFVPWEEILPSADRKQEQPMSSVQAIAVADQIRGSTHPMFAHMRAGLERLGRTIDEVRGLLIAHVMYGASGPPVSLYELTCADQTSWYQWWHQARQEPLTPDQARRLVDLERLAPGDRRFFEPLLQGEESF